MAIAPATLAAFKKLVVATGQLDVRLKALNKEVDKRKQKVKEAIDANDTTLLDVQIKAIKGDMKDIGALLRDDNAQLSDLERLKNDEAFMQERDDDAAKVAEIIAAVRTACAKHAKTLQDLKDQAGDAWRKSMKSEDYALRSMAESETEISELATEVFDAKIAAIKVDGKAAKALEDRDAKALAVAQAELAKLDVGTLKIRVEIEGRVLQDRIKGLADREISDDTMKTLKSGFKEQQDVLKRTEGHMDDLLATEKKIKGCKIEPIDVKKAMDAMALEGSKAEGLLKKVFAGPPSGWEKGLDGVAREMKTGGTGKGYLASLKRAGIVPE